MLFFVGREVKVRLISRPGRICVLTGIVEGIGPCMSIKIESASNFGFCATNGGILEIRDKNNGMLLYENSAVSVEYSKFKGLHKDKVDHNARGEKQLEQIQKAYNPLRAKGKFYVF